MGGASPVPLVRGHPSLLLKYRHVHRAHNFKSQLGLDLIAAERLDGLIQHQLLLGDIDIELGLQPLGNLLGGHGAEQPSAAAGLGGQLHHAALQLLHSGLGLGLLP